MGRVTPPGSPGCVPFPVHLEGQSVLCALGSCPCLWLSSFNCRVPVPVKTHQQQCIVLGVISFRADPMSPRILTASVSHLFLLLLRSSGSLPWPRVLPFHLVLTPGQSSETSFLFPTPIPGLSLKLGQTPRTLLPPLPSFHQPGLLLSFSRDS